jgi:tripartite-type tricarboxylate transporter receptor subunit TctC
MMASTTKPSARLRAWCSAGIIALGMGSATAASAAETYPTRPVRMVIPFAAGGPADFVGRLFAQHLSDLWGQQIVTDNRGGASGIIGTETAIRSNPDGYTLLFGSTSTFAVNLVLIEKLPYDVFRDLQQIGLVANAPHVLAVRAQGVGGEPARSVKDLVATARKQPGKLSFASAGAGTIVHMAGELFKYHAGIDILHVPYKGGAAATVGVLSGESTMVVNDLSVVLAHVKSGQMRALAACHDKRLAPLPDVPTFRELGMPGVVSSTWWGIAVPSATPRAIVDRLAAAHADVVKRPAYAARLAELAMEPLVLDRAQTNAFVKAEIAKWRKIATAANVKLD